MRQITEDMLLGIMSNVHISTESGCWTYESDRDAAENLRWITWGLWHSEDLDLHVFLDRPWCTALLPGEMWTMMPLLCINPEHSCVPDTTYRQLVAASC
jgi:hypothetical protein